MSRADGDVQISRIGGVDSRRVATGGLAASWGVSTVGLLSCRIASRDARALGLGDLKGKWLRWDHPTAGPWGGRIVTDRWTPGEVEIAAESFGSLLRKRRTARTYRQQSSPPGALALRAITDATHDDHLWLASYQADEDGQPIAYEWRGEDVLDLLGSLVNQSGHEWRVDADRAFEWRVRVGVDRRGSVMLADGRHIADWSWVGDLYTVSNDILGVAADRDYERAERYIVADTASIEAYGRLQETVVYRQVTSKSTIEPRARADLAQRKTPASSLEVTLTDTDRCWAKFREGDTVRLWLGDANKVFAYRIVARSVDTGQGVMRCAGDVVEVLT